MTTDDVKQGAAVGFLAFTDAASHGALGGLSDDHVAALADLVASDPSVSASAMECEPGTPDEVAAFVVDECLSQRYAERASGISESRASTASRLVFDREESALERAGLGPDEIARVRYDAYSGRPAKLESLVTESYFA